MATRTMEPPAVDMNEKDSISAHRYCSIHF